MNQLFKLSFAALSFVGLSSVDSFAETSAAKSTTATEKASDASMIATDSAREEKRLQRKMERAKQLLENHLQDFKEMESRFAAKADMTEATKKKVGLALSHAKLELDAAQDPTLIEDILWHTRQAKRYIQRSKYVLEGKMDQFRERAKEKMKEITQDSSEKKL